METMSSSSSFSYSLESCKYDELDFEDSLLFSDSLKDLKNLRSQLYSAAEYFEVSYTDDNQKQIVANALKEYTINALVSTVDHLGSVTYKVNDILDNKVDEVSRTDLRIACIEQRLRTCHECIDRQGLSQQSLVMTAPKYHKRYIFPGKHVEEIVHDSEHDVSKHHGCCLDDENNTDHLVDVVQTIIRDTQPSTIRKGQSRSSSPKPSARRKSFSFTEKTHKQKASEKRAASPLRSMFPLMRSVSPSSRRSTPHSSRPATPTVSRPRTPSSSRHRTTSSFDTRSEYRSRTQKSSSHAEQNNQKDIEQQPSKTKRLFKAFLSRRKAKQDDTLYTFLDEY